MKLNQAVSNNTIFFFNFCITLNEKIRIERQKGRALQRASLQTALLCTADFSRLPQWLPCLQARPMQVLLLVRH